MKKFYTLPILAMLFLPFCANRKAETSKTTKAAISLTVERDCLIAGIQKRLTVLEQEPTTVNFGRVKATLSPAMSRKLDASSASEPIQQSAIDAIPASGELRRNQ